MCFVCANIKYLNHRFHQELVVSEKDYLEIEKIKNVDEIRAFLKRQIPFCRYCRTHHKEYA